MRKVCFYENQLEICRPSNHMPSGSNKVDYCAGMLINFFSNFHRYNKVPYPHNCEELEEALIHAYQGTKIKESIKFLKELGIISVHKNPDPDFKFDKTNFYLYHPEVYEELMEKVNSKTKNKY